jgi:hypothetical protein
MASTESPRARLTIATLAWTFSLTSTAHAILERTYKLELHLRCDASELCVGDEIPIVFTLTNRDDAVCRIEFRERDRSGRVPEHELIATDGDGRQVVDPRDAVDDFWIRGSLGGRRESLAPGQSCSRTIVLNRWARITKPGRYSVTGIFHYSVRDKTVRRAPGIRWGKAVEVPSEPIKIEVLPRGHAETGRYIQSVLKKLHELEGQETRQVSDERRRLIARLAYTCDARIVPTLIDLLYADVPHNEAWEAFHGLLCYLPRTANIKETVLRTATTRGLTWWVFVILEQFGFSEAVIEDVISDALASDDPNVVGLGIGSAIKHPSDRHMSTLIAIATDANHRARRNLSDTTQRTAISALAFHRTDEGVAALKALQQSPQAEVREAVEEAIRKACKRHRVHPPKLDDDFIAPVVPIATDVSHPYRFSAVLLILHTRTAAEAEAIKALAKDPNTHVPVVETDLGVRTIRDLLRHENRAMREGTATRIRAAYHEWPGRPLRKDDFPDPSETDWEEQKRTLLEKWRLVE